MELSATSGTRPLQKKITLVSSGYRRGHERFAFLGFFARESLPLNTGPCLKADPVPHYAASAPSKRTAGDKPRLNAAIIPFSSRRLLCCRTGLGGECRIAAPFFGQVAASGCILSCGAEALCVEAVPVLHVCLPKGPRNHTP